MTASLLWATPDAEVLLVKMARVSNPDSTNPPERLIHYLLEHKHWSPFEMVNLCFHIKTSRTISRQLLRHRSVAVQEFSQRYSEVLEPHVETSPRKQHPTNRQMSLPATPEEKMHHEIAMHTFWLNCNFEYRRLLSKGIAREVARAVLPEGLTPTSLYMNFPLRSFLHFCEVRSFMGGAQVEIVQLAHEMWRAAEPIFPITLPLFAKISGLKKEIYND